MIKIDMEESTQRLGLLNLPLYQYEPLKSIDAVRVVVLEAAAGVLDEPTMRQRGVNVNTQQYMARICRRLTATGSLQARESHLIELSKISHGQTG